MTFLFDPNEALEGHYDFDGICKALDEGLKAAKAKNDSSANQIWRQCQLFGIWRDYIQTYHNLKAGRFYEAWCLIEQILIDCKFLLQNFPEDSNSVEFVRKHLMNLQHLFPYRLFISTVLRIKKVVCSICETQISPWTKCGHIPGNIYNGEICVKTVTDCELLGADIVTDPEHKYSVLFCQDAEGGSIDNYDYSLLKHLLQCWLTPFQDWSVTIEERYVTPPIGLKDTDLCPCYRSIKTYGECCKNLPGILTYHYSIMP